MANDLRQEAHKLLKQFSTHHCIQVYHFDRLLAVANGDLEGPAARGTLDRIKMYIDYAALPDDPPAE